MLLLLLRTARLQLLLARVEHVLEPQTQRLDLRQRETHAGEHDALKGSRVLFEQAQQRLEKIVACEHGGVGKIDDVKLLVLYGERVFHDLCVHYALQVDLPCATERVEMVHEHVHLVLLLEHQL